MIKLFLIDAGHLIPKGWGARVVLCGIHNDPTIYPEPEKFNPDRFDVRISQPNNLQKASMKSR
jgi:cytochrome P450